MKLPSILLVDDEEADRYLLKRRLSAMDDEATVFEASDGDVGLAFLSDFETGTAKYGDAFPPALIFLDINMPRVGGFEFLRRFDDLRRDDPRYRSSVILMLTSSARKDDIASAAVRSSVGGHITKGDLDDELLRRVIEGATRAL
ncbi:MAG: response regulator [Nannocystaceae bacterium]|nr:response regulator [Nannocystaceae bacterium]